MYLVEDMMLFDVVLALPTFQRLEPVKSHPHEVRDCMFTV